MDRTFWDQVWAVEGRVEAVVRHLAALVPGRPLGPMPPGGPSVPPMDVVARDGAVVLRLDLPGVDPARDLAVTADHSELVVRGERHDVSEIDEHDLYRRETFQGAFERHVPLPGGVEAEQITAQYADGVLEISIPAPVTPVTKRKAKHIPVKAPVLSGV